MKRDLFLIGLIAIFSTTAFSKERKTHFTPRDVSNWVYIVNNKNLSESSLFSMDKGILKITDVSTGYLRTRKVYKNFTLSVQWRWTKVAANSGVLIHIQPKDTIWPVCFQVQQKVNAAGDIICMNGLWAKECTDTVKFTVPKMKPSNEKPVNEWNSMTVISKNGNLEVYINEQLQNKITGMTAQKGYIGFQAEGKPVEFRNLIIK